MEKFNIDFSVFFRNGVSVEGATHKQVVDLIKSGGDVLTLKVISVTPQVSNHEVWYNDSKYENITKLLLWLHNAQFKLIL